MEAAMGAALLPQRQELTALISQPATPPGAVYGTAARDAPRGQRERDRVSFDRSYAAFRRLLHGAWRRAELAGQGARDRSGG
jgi:chromosome partitioning protein